MKTEDKAITVGVVVPAQGTHIEPQPARPVSFMASVETDKRRKARDIVGALLVDLVDGWGMTISDESRERWINLVMGKL